MARDDTARFCGQELFGDTQSFQAVQLFNTPGAIDTFLGNTPGTAPGPPVTAYGFSGRFYGSSVAAVQQQISTLASFAQQSAPLGYPTGLRFPDDYWWAPHWCYFLPPELTTTAIVPYPGNQWTCTFKIVFRQTGRCG